MGILKACYFVTGNAITPYQFSNHIRPPQEIECNGTIFKYRELHNFDLNHPTFKHIPQHIKHYIFTYCHQYNTSVIVYLLRHHSKKKKQTVYDAIVITTKKDEIILKMPLYKHSFVYKYIDEFVRQIVK